MRLSAAVTFLLLLTLGAVAWSLEPIPIGEEFQVNSYTTDYQHHADIEANQEGNFVVVWTSYGSYGLDNSGGSIQGQRYDATGDPLGGQFQVNSYKTSNQRYPSVAVDGDGDFVVVWTSPGSFGNDNKGYSIQGQRFDAEGDLVGGEFQVNSYTTSAQQHPSVAVDGSGDFIVMWTSSGSTGTDTQMRSIQGQRYDADGNPLGSQFQVNTYTRFHQQYPSVAVGENGSFVVVWASYGSHGSDTDFWSVQGQIYNADGNPVGGEFQVNSYTTSHQQHPSVGVDGYGDFVVVWQSRGSFGTDSSYWSVQGQLYDAEGNPVGGEFQVNTYTSYIQYRPSVAVDADGDFIVVWQSVGSYGSDSSSNSIQGQQYDAGGDPVGGQFQVNTYTTSTQDKPWVTTDGQGDFVVAWTSSGSEGSDQSYRSIQGQRYTLPILFDGFESGDTSAWSSTVP